MKAGEKTIRIDKLIIDYQVSGEKIKPHFHLIEINAFASYGCEYEAINPQNMQELKRIQMVNSKELEQP